MKGYIRFDFQNIYYEDSEHLLEPILFLHGNGEDHTYFEKLQELFKDKCRIINIDMRSHGKSSFYDFDLSFEMFADDVLKVLEKLNINEINIVGFSDGASTALTLALSKKIKINKMVLVGANYSVEGLKKETHKKIESTCFISRLLRPFSVKYKRKFFLNKLMLTQPNFTKEQLESIDVKSLLIYGENDCIYLEHANQLANYLNAPIITILNASHDVILEKVNEVFNFIYDFIFDQDENEELIKEVDELNKDGEFDIEEEIVNDDDVVISEEDLTFDVNAPDIIETNEEKENDVEEVVLEEQTEVVEKNEEAIDVELNQETKMNKDLIDAVDEVSKLLEDYLTNKKEEE